MWAFINWGLFIPEYLATVSLIMFDAVDAGKIVVVVDFVAISADVEMLFGEEPMMNSVVSMFAFLGGKRERYFLACPSFNILFGNCK